MLHMSYRILMAIVNINPLKKQLLLKPNVTTRGFIMVNENADLIDKIEKKMLILDEEGETHEFEQ